MHTTGPHLDMSVFVMMSGLEIKMASERRGWEGRERCEKDRLWRRIQRDRDEMG